ncbi:MAG: CHASE domain-containing protein [Verrucomicrobiota bacterium]
MAETARRPPKSSYRTAIALVVVAGVALSLFSYRLGKIDEEEKATAEFSHRAALRHALIREILVHYEDALFGLSALFVSSDDVTVGEFNAATQRIGSRISGVQALEWVPLVPRSQRGAVEAMLSRSHNRPIEFVEFTSGGGRKRTGDRAEHYPIVYIQPIPGNEVALGYDLMSSGNLPFLERARESQKMILTAPFRLVQEKESKLGVVMICPVHRTRDGREGFSGFLLCVFRLHDLLEAAHNRQSDAALDTLFVDGSESDPAKRQLYYRPADNAAPRTPTPEAEFRAGLHRDFSLPFGERDWRVIFRPRDGWLESQRTTMPLLRSAAVLALSALVAGMVLIVGRRTETIQREVGARTAELAESRRQIAHMLHALPGMAYRCSYDEQLNVLFLSEGARELTGWTAEEFVSGVAHFRDCIHPDDLARVREVTRGALQEQHDVEVEYRLRTRGGEEKWVLSRGRGVYSAEGDLRFFEGLAIDITAQKKAESARLELERKLLEGQKLESLGLLAGGIAHDFNNLLGSIVGNVSVARLGPPGGNMDVPLRSIETAAWRAAELCRQMLAYAGKGRFVVEPLDLTALVEDLLPLLKVSVARHGTLRLELARSLPAVMADATQLRQIVMNLVLNAADAVSSRKGAIVVVTGTMHADAALLEACAAGAELAAGSYVFVEVRDNGTGMTPEVLAKIFDPFFTTKFAGRGLGLAAVLGIVRGHRGALRVESKAGEGSSFRLLLPPVAAPAMPVRSPESMAGARWRKSGRVLIVEDEEPVRTVTAALLQSYGLTPLPTADGPAGIALFRQESETIDLVMLDLLMPVMRGEQVLEELRAIKPDVRVLLMSGYSESDVVGRIAAGAGRLAFIAKPFTATALERKLREMLE